MYDRLDPATEPEGTEDRNPRTIYIDRVPTLQALRLINAEDRRAIDVVAGALEEIARAVDAMLPLFRAGGTVHYFGAGTSGRLCVLDAAEIPPTYGVPGDRFRAHIAGGQAAMTSAVEDAEDSDAASARIVRELVRDGDIVIAVAASGRTPYAVGAAREARRRGVLTIAVAGAAGSVLSEHADVTIAIPTGAEAITGSTRMKAATAQKVVLHSLSTALMVRSGHTVSNLMVGVVASNAKLRRRSSLMIEQATGRTTEEVQSAIQVAGGDLRVALRALGTGSDERRRACTIGVDAGGSGVRIQWRSEDGPDDDPRIGAPGRFTATTLAAHAAAPLIAELRKVLAQHPSVEIEGIGIALAGAEDDADAAQVVADAVARSFGADVVVASDGVAHLIAAHGDAPGVVLAVGTGAVAFLRKTDGAIERTDGLGFEIGDFGSGARIGADAARRAMRSIGGYGPRDEALERCFLTHFGGVAELQRRLRSGEPSATLFAGFAEPFLRLGAVGHEAATAAGVAAADDLVHTVERIIGREHLPVALVGGMLGTDSPVGRIVRDRLRERGIALIEPATTVAALMAVAASGGHPIPREVARAQGRAEHSPIVWCA